jgi:co-chaperonin GroES (HSP10)
MEQPVLDAINTNTEVSSFRLLGDQVLVEPQEKPELFDNFNGVLYLPQKPERGKGEFFYVGRVVSCGPGDKIREGKVRPDGSRAAYLAPEQKCEDCNGMGLALAYGGMAGLGAFVDCPTCHGTGKVSGRWPIHVKPGDLVLYERRPWAEVELDRKRYVILHEEQHIVAVIEE